MNIDFDTLTFMIIEYIQFIDKNSSNNQHP